MRTAHVLRIASWHIALYLLVIVYILTGAYTFFWLENEIEINRHKSHKELLVIYKQTLIREIAENKSVSIHVETLSGVYSILRIYRVMCEVF